MRILLIVLFLNAQALASNLTEWKPLKSSGIASSWKHNELKSTLLVFKNSFIKNEKFNESIYAKELVRTKKKLLSYLGISQWKVENSYWKDNRFHLVGSYVDSDNELIFFVEVHKKNKDKIEQLLYTTPFINKDRYKSNEIANLFEKVRLVK